MNTKQITTSDTMGKTPDVLVYDTGLQQSYVAAESGVVAALRINGATLEQCSRTYFAPKAHTLVVDSRTHRVYMPLGNIDGRPVLRTYEPS